MIYRKFYHRKLPKKVSSAKEVIWKVMKAYIKSGRLVILESRLNDINFKHRKLPQKVRQAMKACTTNEIYDGA